MLSNYSYNATFNSFLSTDCLEELKTILNYFESKDAYTQYRYKSVSTGNSRDFIRDILYTILNNFHSQDGSTFSIFRIGSMNADTATAFFNSEVESHILSFTGCTYNAALSSIYAIRRKYVRAYSDNTGKKQIIFVAHELTTIEKIQTMQRALCLQLASVLDEDLDRSKLNDTLNFADSISMAGDLIVFFNKFKELLPADYLQTIEAAKQQQELQAKQHKLKELKKATDAALAIDYERKIQLTKDELIRLRITLMSTYDKLKRFQQRQFAIDYLSKDTDNSHPFTTALLDFLDNHPAAYGFYFEQITDRESVLYLTVKSYLTPSDSLSDFIRGLSRSRAGNEYQTLIAGIDAGTLKIPVLGTIAIKFVNDETLKIVEVSGISTYYDMKSDSLPNSHIDKEYAINAHIGRYNCFAQGKSAILEAFYASKYDYIFEAMIESVGNYNFYDGTVMEVNASNIHNAISHNIPALLRDTTGWKQINLGGIDEILNADGQPIGNQPQVPAQETEEAGNDIPF